MVRFDSSSMKRGEIWEISRHERERQLFNIAVNQARHHHADDFTAFHFSGHRILELLHLAIVLAISIPAVTPFDLISRYEAGQRAQ